MAPCLLERSHAIDHTPISTQIPGTGKQPPKQIEPTFPAVLFLLSGDDLFCELRKNMSFWSWICIFTVTFGLNMLPKPWHKWGSPACQHLDQRSCPQTRFHSCGAPPKNSKESRFELVWTWIEFHLYTQYNSIPVSVKIQSTNSNSTSLDSSSKRSWKIMFAQA